MLTRAIRLIAWKTWISLLKKSEWDNPIAQLGTPRLVKWKPLSIITPAGKDLYTELVYQGTSLLCNIFISEEDKYVINENVHNIGNTRISPEMCYASLYETIWMILDKSKEYLDDPGQIIRSDTFLFDAVDRLEDENHKAYIFQGLFDSHERLKMKATNSKLDENNMRVISEHLFFSKHFLSDSLQYASNFIWDDVLEPYGDINSYSYIKLFDITRRLYNDLIGDFNINQGSNEDSESEKQKLPDSIVEAIINTKNQVEKNHKRTNSIRAIITSPRGDALNTAVSISAQDKVALETTKHKKKAQKIHARQRSASSIEPVNVKPKKNALETSKKGNGKKKSKKPDNSRDLKPNWIDKIYEEVKNDIEEVTNAYPAGVVTDKTPAGSGTPTNMFDAFILCQMIVEHAWTFIEEHGYMISMDFFVASYNPPDISSDHRKLHSGIITLITDNNMTGIFDRYVVVDNMTRIIKKIVSNHQYGITSVTSGIASINKDAEEYLRKKNPKLSDATRTDKEFCSKIAILKVMISNLHEKLKILSDIALEDISSSSTTKENRKDIKNAVKQFKHAFKKYSSLFFGTDDFSSQKDVDETEFQHDLQNGNGKSIPAINSITGEVKYIDL